MKRILALVLAAVMMLAVVACGGSAPQTSSTQSSAPAQAAEAPAAANTEAAEAPAAAKSYQFVGKYEEEGANAGMLNAAFLLNLNEDGTAVADRYQFAQYDASPATSNPTYQASYMSGTWKEVEKDGIPCLQIKLAHIDESGASSNDQTAYAYEIAGEYSFDLTFPIVPGMSYSRTAPMLGTEEKVYADADAFIAANKLDFVEPASIAKFVSDAATIYLQDGGAALLYLATSKAAEGTWSAGDGLSVEFNGETYTAALNGNSGEITFSLDRGDGQMVDYKVSCDDLSALAGAAPAEAEAAAPAEDAPYTGEGIDLGGNKYDPSLVLNADGTAVLTVAMGMAVKYERLGNIVILFQDENAPLEGYGATIFGIVPNAWEVNDETKTMTGLKAAYIWPGEGAQLTFSSVDGETMTLGLPAYGMSGDGYTYAVSEDGSTLTLTAPESWEGAWGQVWQQMGAPTVWTIDGIHVNPAA